MVAGSNIGSRSSKRAASPVIYGQAMLVPAFTLKPLPTKSDGDDEDVLEKHETIIAPGAVTSGFSVPFRSGPGLLKFEIVSRGRPTAREPPEESIHVFREVNEATVIASLAVPG